MSDRDAPPGILAGSRERFEDSTDFTVGIEEEYQLLDLETLELTNRFEDLMAAADEPLRGRLAGVGYDVVGTAAMASAATLIGTPRARAHSITNVA